MAVEMNSCGCDAPSNRTRAASAPRCLFGRWNADRLNVAFVVAKEVSLFVFTIDLGSASRCGSVVGGRDVRAVGYEVLLEGLPLPFTQLEYGTVKTTAVIEVFDCENVIFLVREKANHSSSTERNCSFAQHHCRTSYLLVFILDKDVLNGAYLHLGSRTSIPPKLHRVTLNFQVSGGVMPRTFKTQDMYDMDGRSWGRALCFALSLGIRSGV